MIRQEIYIPKYDWTIYAYYAVDDYYVNEIACRLYGIGCRGDFMERAIRNMESRKLNQGLTYSNQEARESVMVVALTSSSRQFLNSLVHEVRHLANHICEASGVDLASEESCYVSGDIVMEIYPRARGLLCEHCRHKYIHYENRKME